MQGNPVVWFEIYVQDMARACRFYETVLGKTLVKMVHTSHDMWAFPMEREGFGASGALIKMDGVPSRLGGTLIYFSCADCAVEEARVTAAGGRIEKTKFAIGPYGHIALCYDTEGNLFGLHSM